MALSPPAWGWSGILAHELAMLAAFPTRVGMVRHVGARGIRDACFPHPRGDGPDVHFIHAQAIMLSPPAWGWSEIS